MPDNAGGKKITKGQTKIYKPLHRKLRIKQQNSTKTGINSGALEG